MNRTLRGRLLAVLAILGAALASAACAQPAAPPGGSPTGSGSATAPPASSTPPAPTSPPSTTVYGPVWPLEPRTLSAARPTRAPALTAIRTGRHDTYDRLVFDFSGGYGSVSVRYVPMVHADPSDLTVPLQGNAFLEITIHDAYARWLGQQPSYGGPDSVTPGLPTLRQVTLSGDFENVLSLGVGVDRTAGFQVMRLRSPDRLVIDFAYPPAWRMWPDASLVQAQQVQAAFDSGHQSWRGSVVAYYAQQVYGWTDARVTKITGTDEYWVSASGSTERIRVRQVYPFQATHSRSIAEIADVR